MLRSRAVAVVLASIAGVAATWATVLWLCGGVTITLAGVHVSSNNVWRPALVSAGALGLLLLVQGVERTRALLLRAMRFLTPARAALALALATTVVSLADNSWTASGPDSFAYVSQAALWRTGQLDIPVPLAADAPWPNAVATFSMPGYRPAPGGAPALVPVTAPGLPLLMAALQTLGGHAAAFVITPVAAGALVWVTFLIGRRVGSPAVGLMAACFVATSPAFLFMLMWPMTDIPAAAITAVMVWCLLGGSTASAAAAGLAAAAGVVMRPNFVAIAAGAGLWLAIVLMAQRGDRTSWRRLLAFGVAVIPGACVVLVANARWYGSALSSGYGSYGGLLSIGRVSANLAHYTRWLAEASPIAFVGLAALAAWWSRLWPTPHARRAGLLLVLTTIAAWSVYLVYGEFEDWWYLRFLLPAWPAMFVAAGVVLVRVARVSRAAAVLVAAVIVATAAGGVEFARARGVFNLGATERRYATIAMLVNQYTEPGAVILASQHSGTVWYCAARDTLRHDLLDPAWLDRAIAWLAARGRHPYVLVEDWERPEFEARFAQSNIHGRLTMPPILAWHSAHTPGDVFLYDPIGPSRPTAQPGPDIEDALPRSATPVTR